MELTNWFESDPYNFKLIVSKSDDEFSGRSSILRVEDCDLGNQQFAPIESQRDFQIFRDVQSKLFMRIAGHFTMRVRNIDVEYM